MRLAQIGAAAKIRNAVLFEQRQRFAEGGFAVVARVIIGQRHRVQVALEHRQHARMGAEGEDLLSIARPVVATGVSRLPMV